MRKLGTNVRLREIREFLGLNQKAFSEMLGIRQNYLSRYETGEHEFTDDLKLKLADVIAQNYEKRINLDWFLSGNGEMFMPEPGKNPQKPSLVAELGAIIDQRLERIEAQIAEIEGRLDKKGIDGPDSGMFVSEPEPEYGEDEENVVFVEGIAAGKPIFQSEARSIIPVPKRFIRTRPEDYYVGRIKGTSMTAAGIPDGVLVLIRISDIPRNGAIQVVECQGEATLKRMREIPGRGWKICFDDHTGRYIEVGPEDEYHIQGDFIAVLPDKISSN
jgi:SOS-response transcriptional repressor LexA/DNA-binding XRE family transcriptional regulator